MVYVKIKNPKIIRFIEDMIVEYRIKNNAF